MAYPVKQRRTEKKKKSIFLRIALIVFALYAIMTLAQAFLEIRAKGNELNNILHFNQQVATDNQVKDEALADRDTLLDDAAHDSGYANQGDTIYKEGN